MIRLLVLSLALSQDSFSASVAVATGTAERDRPQRSGLALAFAVCDGAALVAGRALGDLAARSLGGWSGPTGRFVLFAYVAYLLWAVLGSQESAGGRWMVFGLPLSLSLDNLVVGVAIGTMGFPWLVSVLVVASASGGLSFLGYGLGSKLRASLSRRLQLVAALLLLLLLGLR